MTRIRLILACLLAPAAAMAQTDAPTPASLDLSVPQEPIRYLSDPSYQADAPGAYYGDRSGRSVSREKAEAQARMTDDKLQVHGSVSTGIGYSKQFGNSHWSSASLNLGKNYTNDDGQTRRFDVNINVSKGEGAGYFGPGYGHGFGPMPGYGW